MVSHLFGFQKKASLRLWPLILLLAVSACVSQHPQPYPAPLSRPADAEDLAFQQAESLFTTGQADQSLSYYSSYLGQYPQGRYAALALYRLGAIYQRQGDLSAAQAFFKRSLELFPQSPVADEVHLALIDLLIQENHSEEAIDSANQLLQSDLSEKMRQQLYQRLLTLYQSSQDKKHVAYFAYSLFKSAPPEEKEHWEVLLKESISRLDATDIDALWDRMDDPQIRSDLMYQYAVTQVALEHYGDALDVLSAFQKAYPNHPKAGEAAYLMEVATQHLKFAPYTLGCLLPLTGAYEAYGQRALNAVTMALSMFQQSESAAPIKLIVKDTGSSDERAVLAVRELAKEQVGAIIGPISTAVAAAQEAQKLNIPIITFTQKPEITAIGNYVFRHFITPQNQVKTIVQYFIKDLDMRDFAILYPQEAYGQTFMKLFWDEVVRQGGRIVGIESYDTKQTDFAVSIKKLVGNHYAIPADLQKRPLVQTRGNDNIDHQLNQRQGLEAVLPNAVNRLSGIFYQDPDAENNLRSRNEEKDDAIVDFDVLFIPDSPKMAAMILPQLAYHDITNIYVAGTNLWHSRQLIDLCGPYAQNAVFVDGYFNESTSEVVQKFAEAYRNIYNAEPNLMDAYAFDTANLLFSLLSRPDIRLRHELRNALEQTVFADGITGPTAFNAEGEALKRLSLMRIKGDQFIEIPHP